MTMIECSTIFRKFVFVQNGLLRLECSTQSSECSKTPLTFVKDSHYKSH